MTDIENPPTQSGTSLAGKNIILTGGTTGIGRAIGILLSKSGANIFTFGREQQPLTEALDAMNRAGGNAKGITADVSIAEDVKRVFKEADKIFDKLDILICNAGLAIGGIADSAEEDWRYVVETNLMGYLACSKQGIERMKPKKEGHIMFIGSMSAESKNKGSSVYVATKTGIRGFASSLRKELNPEGIKVTLVEPGKTDADMQNLSRTEAQEKQKNLELLRAEDIAEAVKFVLTRPKRSDVVMLQMRPHLEEN